MSDSWTTPRETTPENTNGGNGYQGSYAPNAGSSYENDDGDGDIGKAVVVAILGGLVSAAGYMIYRRLPDDQKDRLHGQVRTIVQQRISELRQNFNI